MRLYSLLFAAMLSLTGCASDIGVTHTIEENVLGEFGHEHGVAYAQAADITFLVDTSGSMGDDQEELASYMPDIYDTLTGPDFTDFEWCVHLGTTDGADGILASVCHDDDDAYLKLLTMTSFLGTSGWEEAGLDSAIHHVGWSGVFRDDADLLFIFISDEPDQSSVSVSTYEQIMSAAKEDPFLVTESAIVFTGETDWNDGDCSDSAGNYNLGSGYIDVSEVVINLCDSGWDRALDVTREHVPTLNEKWPLNDGVPASPTSIVVFFDDYKTNDWYYEKDENAVYLTAIPDPGTVVTIDYLIAPEEEL